MDCFIEENYKIIYRMEGGNSITLTSLTVANTLQNERVNLNKSCCLS